MIKPIWCVAKKTGFKLPQKMQLNDNLTADFDGVMNMISLERGSNSIGRELFGREKDFLKCIDIEIENNAEKRKGFGSLIHALSIMLMKENKAKYIHLNSLPQAIKFHYMNGFRTASGNNEAAAACMRSIIKSDTPFASLKERANDLWLRLSLKDPKAKIEADRLYDEYLESVFKNGIPEQQANFPSTVDMKLTLKDAMKNNAKHNDILNKFGIDYTI